MSSDATPSYVRCGKLGPAMRLVAKELAEGVGLDFEPRCARCDALVCVAKSNVDFARAGVPLHCTTCLDGPEYKNEDRYYRPTEE